jgi:dihydrolipoamide dehydrogenase
MNPFGMIIPQAEGIIEIMADKTYGETLGVHFIGQGVYEMAGQALLAIQMEATLEELIRATFPYPTLSQCVAEAATECLGRPICLP